jgi:murein DD-endopeptidase MepM/ murein hydrolase activator NlpD/subtilisin-like proprotein convertase family protein
MPPPVTGNSASISTYTICQYGGDFNLRIPADPNNTNTTRGWMDNAVIQIPDHFTIADLDISITVTHTKVFDLQIFLQSPAGTRLCLNSYNLDEYFNGENYTQTVFDDEAEIPIEQALPPFTGQFRPESGTLLSSFDGQDAFGGWRLQIYDCWFADMGTLDNFQLVVNRAEAFSGAGSGTEQDPYIITNVYQLQEMNNDLDAWYELSNDIDVSETKNWNGGAGFTPIGNQHSYFTGHFDGKGHKITGLYISRSDSSFIGLFGASSGSVIKNVGLVNVDVNAVNGYGVGGLVGGNTSTITNCYSTGSVSGYNGVGGLVGVNYGNGTITNCYSTVSVSEYDCGGGLVGENNGNISNCYFLSISGPNNGYGAPLTDGQMKQKSSFVGWDFENVWNIIEGQTCPFLISQMVRPVDGWLVQRFDFDEDVGYQGHEGIDVDSGIEGKNVVAAADGVIAYVHRSITSGAGLWVWICHGVVPSLNGNLQADISTRYLHLKDIPDEILPGAEVIKGRTVIGKVSNTGDGLWKWRFPPHLHLEVRQGGSLDDIMTGKITYKNTTALNPLRFVEYEDRYKKAKSLTILPHSPIDLIVEDPDGLIISKGIVEFPAASYFEIPIDEEENPGYEFIAIDNRKQGKYSIKVIPEPNALPTNTYSLEATIDGQTMVLAEDVQIQDIPAEPYQVESKLIFSDFDNDTDVDFADLAKLSYHWLSQDCNYPDWCEGADLNYNHFVDLIDISLFVEHWLEGL